MLFWKWKVLHSHRYVPFVRWMEYTDVMIALGVMHSIHKDSYGSSDSRQAILVKDARLTLTYSFLLVSWAGDTHEETDVLPIDN